MSWEGKDSWTMYQVMQYCCLHLILKKKKSLFLKLLIKKAKAKLSLISRSNPHIRKLSRGVLFGIAGRNVKAFPRNVSYFTKVKFRYIRKPFYSSLLTKNTFIKSTNPSFRFSTSVQLWLNSPQSFYGYPKWNPDRKGKKQLQP